MSEIEECRELDIGIHAVSRALSGSVRVFKCELSDEELNNRTNKNCKKIKILSFL